MPTCLTLLLTLYMFKNVIGFMQQKVTIAGKGTDITGLSDVPTEMWGMSIHKSFICSFIQPPVFSFCC